MKITFSEPGLPKTGTVIVCVGDAGKISTTARQLDKAAGDPVDVYVNGRHVARGEVLVLNDNFCIRVSEILPLGMRADHLDQPASAEGRLEAVD